MKCNISVAALLVGLAPSASAKADGGKQLRRSRKLYDDGTTNSKDDGRNYVVDSGKTPTSVHHELSMSMPEEATATIISPVLAKHPAAKMVFALSLP
ncbi:hypothetical protein ACHAXH_004747 [Discostella pseudostelligera]